VSSDLRVVEEICYSGKIAGHTEKSINCMMLMGGRGFTLDLDPFFFICIFSGGVFIDYGHHAFWVNMASKVSVSQQVYSSVHQAHAYIV